MIRRPSKRNRERSGTTAVELAFILPVILVVYFALIEFGHVYLSVNVIKSAARYAGRLGVTNGATNDQVTAEANRVLGTMMNPALATIAIKDGATFDDNGAAPTSYDSLPAVNVNDLEARELFVVRITVPYNSISLFPSGFWHTYVHDLTLSGQAVMRHE
jgi:Flp pilus assembly protein TadG